MFGANPLRPAVRDDGKQLAVNSVFGTIQGEGPFSGEPAIFVRLAGCNLACWFCDTEFEAGVDDRIPVIDLLNKVHAEADKVRADLIVITGGEPLRQNIVPFVEVALHAGWRVQIETAGTVVPDDFNRIGALISTVCSPKTGKVNELIERHCRDWKYIVAHDDTSVVDGLPALGTQRKGVHARLFRPDPKVRSHRIWVQPREDYLPDGRSDLVSNEKNRAIAATVAMKYGYRLSLQTHKILGLP